MSLTECNVHFIQQPDKVVYASRALIKQLRLTSRKLIHLKLGKETITASMMMINRKGKHLYIPSIVRNSIMVPKSGNIFAMSQNPEELQIGPLIGVLCDSATRSASQPFGVKTAFIKQLLKEGSRKAFYFAFAPRDINWQQETVLGYFLSDSGGWFRKTVPLPDVIYNRLPSRKAETTATIESLKERFVRRKIPLFNWTFFNKNDVYNMLETEPETFQYVPESVIGPSPEKIKEMLDKYQFVYLKPTAGSLGKGIYRLTYHPKKGYFARYRRNGENVLLRFSSFNSLIRMLHAHHKSRLKSYVVQQGIRLLELDGCPLDFRFHMHKNGDNEWVVAAIGAKKAGKGSVTTHIKNGGQLLTPEQALSRVFGDRAEEVLDNAKKVAHKLAESIERNYPHLLGELGFDLGIDRNERIWMFEANAKPGRSIFKHPSLKEQGKASLSYIFDHCLYLSKFHPRREE